MRRGRSISNPVIQFFFNKDYNTIRHLLNPVGTLGRVDVPESRIPTVKGMTRPWIEDDDEPDRFDLGERGYALPPRQFDAGDGMDLEETEEPNNVPDETINGKLTAIWYQFLIDIIQKAPNPKGQINGSYCRLPKEDRLKVRDDFYQNRTLSDVWRVCQYKTALPDVWKNTFTRFWPSKDHTLSPSAQNYSTCRYYVDWKLFVSDTPTDVVKASHTAIKEKFDALYWIPAATCDKIWNTNKAAKGFTVLPVGYKGPAPQLLIRGKQHPVWQ
jgi:hypothetical protein